MSKRCDVCKRCSACDVVDKLQEEINQLKQENARLKQKSVGKFLDTLEDHFPGEDQEVH